MKRFEFFVGRVHVPPNRDWSLYLTLWGFQFEVKHPSISGEASASWAGGRC